MWHAFRFRIFEGKMRQLRRELMRIMEKCPERLKGHPLAILYNNIFTVMEQIREKPDDEKYLLGDALGDKHKDWRRAKKGLPQRYRLFFKFFSSNREVYYAWFNDERTLRKEGSKTDCYAVFKRMLDRGDVPSSREALLAGSVVVEEERN